VHLCYAVDTTFYEKRNALFLGIEVDENCLKILARCYADCVHAVTVLSQHHRTQPSN